MISEEIDRLIAEAGDLPPRARVLAAVLRRLAAELDAPHVAPYAVGGLAQQMRTTVSEFSALAPCADKAPGVLSQLRADVLARQQ